MRVKNRRELVDANALAREIESNLQYLSEVDKEYRNQLLGIDTSEAKVLFHKIALHRAESQANQTNNRRI